MSSDVFIIAARRTPIGSFLGCLSSVCAPDLAATAISAALKESRVEPDQVSEVFLGNVLSAGIGQSPARQASLAAQLPTTVPTSTIGKVCGSGLQAVILGARTIMASEAEIVVAGGMESMSRVPHYLLDSRTGLRMGNGNLVDGMIHDGLWDPYSNSHMGQAAELCAKEFSLSREAQDAFAAESYRRALAAQKSGLFNAEMAPVTIPQRRGEPIVISADEEPRRGKLDKFDKLRPAFSTDGTITAANASSLNDGAAAVILASAKAVERFNLQPLARIVANGAAAQPPEWFTTAPAKAIEQALGRAQLTADDIDLWEVNEAFSCVTMACARLAKLDPNRTNVHGGAVALGHPIGASGARVLTTLLHALHAHGKRRGAASLCIGGGEAVAMVVERI